MIKRQTSISKNIVHFCRFLRLKDFAVSVEEEAIALQALQFIDFTSNSVFRLALQSILCRSKDQLNKFDNLFYTYWKEIGRAVDAKRKDDQTKANIKLQGASHKSLKAWLHGNRNIETEETATYSRQEHLSIRNFSAVPEDEVGELMQTIKALSKRLAARANRRYESSPKIARPDLLKTLRKNMRSGGELIEIFYRKPKRNRLKLVLLCDVSRSMELYTAFLLQFMYAFQQVYRRMETFVFSTTLNRITPLLNQHNFREALHLLSSEKSDWASGTRIGESLETFVKDHAKNMVDSNTIVIILSDGWDTGDTEPLIKSMEYMHNKSKKIIWLNPLAGYPGFQPDVTGMKTAMPYIDLFAPVHNAESFRRLVRLL